MLRFFADLVDTSDFPARWHCGRWSQGHGWLHILSDLSVFAAYVAIPTMLVLFAVRRRDIPFHRFFWLFAAFILTCGTTHFVEALIFWEPVYRLSGILKLATAIASWATVIALVPGIPKILSLRSPAQLEHQVQQRTHDLEESKRALESFSYSVSHDLRAPLRAIGGFAQILEEDHADRLNEKGREALWVIHRNVRNMGQLIDGLLDLSRVGQAAIDLRCVPMTRLVNEVWDELTSASQRADRKLECRDLPDAFADPVLIRQVWWNLLDNALKYSRASSAPVKVGASMRERDVCYWVTDSGVGFDSTQNDKLFEPFGRLHAPDEHEGTGVGLALTARIVERHWGEIGAQSAPGRGATFWFTLPVPNRKR